MTTPADRDALEAERDFLLRSLDDLDAERTAGNIDDSTFAQLHADYTARAAAVLRQLRDGLDVGPPAAPSTSGARRWLPIAAIAVFAIVAAGLLAQSVHSRNPGGALTGNDPAASATVSRTALENAVKSHPNDYNARIALARFMLNRDVKEAVVQYDAAAKLAPKQPEPVTYAGWINALVAGQLKPGDKDRTLLLGRAMERFAHAIDIAPTYADTFVFRGITRMRVIGDMKGAIPDLQRFLQLAPADHPQRELVLGALRQAVAGTNQSTNQSTSTTVPPTTNP
ncbi:MAG: hypothetical protein QOI55_1521 [Actinomycetota bacterium]|nr:hypothetical protein [Actinomycetota bacterium]